VTTKYRKTLARVRKGRTERIEPLKPNFENLSEWSILDHHNSLSDAWGAIGEYLKLLELGIIPKDSKLALGVISGRLVDGEVRDRLAVKFAILPDNQMRVLESSRNSDILQAEIATTGTLPFRGKLLILTISEDEVEVPDDLVPEGFRKCKECGKLFEKEGRRVFCSEPCRSRFHARKTMRKKRKASISTEQET